MNNADWTRLAGAPIAHAALLSGGGRPWRDPAGRRTAATPIARAAKLEASSKLARQACLLAAEARSASHATGPSARDRGAHARRVILAGLGGLERRDNQMRRLGEGWESASYWENLARLQHYHGPR